MSSEVQVDVTDRVALLTLNRPAQQNAMTPTMADALGGALHRCDLEDAVRAVVITGTPPAFCAGTNLTGRGRKPDPKAVSITVEPAPWRVRKPVIAAVNGHAVGFGLALALQCDLRYVADDAIYGLVQTRRGVLADGYVHWTLPRLIGVARAAELMLTGRSFDGTEAQALGLANLSLSADEVLPTALAVARDIATGTAPLATALSKRLLWAALDMSPDAVGRLEQDLRRHLSQMPDAGEGVAAYLDRRMPDWHDSVTTNWPAGPWDGPQQTGSIGS
ncbi:enoyl-CoA hydratase/isomerase family protein [Skermania piniformis]|uniref:Enoyl-CoA hydratase/isomerase family protein n=1 Tax=Skermania pinensis TaxID=39122 RepID=A0ABX8S7A1_9ACTN|nr:enoyl-CoA hydratase-related protein [Skermania piniformis]QXQ13618.1 enoyl-CoA hydratase/isomerase family protein [Skermania piniformis]